MKKLRYLFPALTLLLFACDTDDDGFYNAVYVQSSGLMTIENPSNTYNSGDVILVEAHIPRLLTEPGQSELLDVRATTSADTSQFSFLLEKLNGTQWELVDVTGNFVPGTEGSANVGFFVQGFLDFDNVADAYLFNGGVRVVQPGTYRLNFSNNTDDFEKVFLRSNSPGNNLVMNIFSSSVSLDSAGVFEFTVN